MIPLQIPSGSHPLLFLSLTTKPYLFPTTSPNPSPTTTSKTIFPAASKLFPSRHRYRSSPYSSDSDSTFLGSDDDDDSGNSLLHSEPESESGNGTEIEIEKLDNNSRRIRSRIAIDASLLTIWNILTDYERLADFIPGLAVSQLIEKRDNFARLFQIGQQNLAFGLKFNAKVILDCYEKDLEILPCGQKRDIEFKMIEGDFQIFEGRWSIEQYKKGRCEGNDSSLGQEFHSTLSYVVDVKPKLWLPVHLVEGRLCREIKINLSCIREEAQKAIQNTLPIH